MRPVNQNIAMLVALCFTGHTLLPVFYKAVRMVST